MENYKLDGLWSFWSASVLTKLKENDLEIVLTFSGEKMWLNPSLTLTFQTLFQK